MWRVLGSVTEALCAWRRGTGLFAPAPITQTEPALPGPATFPRHPGPPPVAGVAPQASPP